MAARGSFGTVASFFGASEANLGLPASFLEVQGQSCGRRKEDWEVANTRVLLRVDANQGLSWGLFKPRQPGQGAEARATVLTIMAGWKEII